MPRWPLLLAVVVAGACSSSGRTASGPGPTASTPHVVLTAPPPATTVPAPTTTAYAPTAPQASPDGAAARLINAWSRGDRSGAAAVAAPAAVGTLFTIAYPSGQLQGRGCTDASTDPGTCTYRNTATNALYELTVTRAPGGWYVSAVTPET